MGNHGWRGKPRRERVLRNPFAVEQTEALLGKRNTLDAVEVKNRRMRSEARPDGRERVLLGPIALPVRDGSD